MPQCGAIIAGICSRRPVSRPETSNLPAKQNSFTVLLYQGMDRLIEGMQALFPAAGIAAVSMACPGQSLPGCPLQPNRSQSLIQVGYDVLRLFQPNAEADEAPSEFLRVEVDALIVAGLWEDQTLIVSERHGKGDDL